MRRFTVLTLAVMALTASFAGSAPAASTDILGCGEQELEQPFLRFLDPMSYVLAPGGDFESGAAGWQLAGGARVVSGNEPFNVRGSGSGSNALYLPRGSSAVSPATCVGLLHPTLRFFVQRNGGLLASLKVEMLYTGLLGRQMSVELLPGVLGSSAWAPTLPQVTLGSLLPILSLDGLTADVRFRFTPRSLLFSSADFRIDDVYVDPFKLI